MTVEFCDAFISSIHFITKILGPLSLLVSNRYKQNNRQKQKQKVCLTGVRSGWLPASNVTSAVMTGGLVQEYEYVVLYTVTPRDTLIITLAAMMVRNLYIYMYMYMYNVQCHFHPRGLSHAHVCKRFYFLRV